jgi:putative spermidine/putrescine transport system permease protein
MVRGAAIGERGRVTPFKAGVRRTPMYGPLLLLAMMFPLTALLAAAFVIPMASAVASSLTGTQNFGGEYQIVAGSGIFWVVLIRTFYMAALVTAICMLLAYPTAEMINRAGSRLKPLLLALVLVPLWSSVIARTYAWFGMFRSEGVVDKLFVFLGLGHRELLFSQTAVIVGMVHVMLPLLLLPVYAAVVRYDENLTLASLSLGANRLSTMIRVKLPVLAPQLLASAAAIFILSLAFYITPSVLGGPHSQMISNLVSQQVFDRFDFSRANALGVALLVSTLVVLAAVGLTLRVVGRRR